LHHFDVCVQVATILKPRVMMWSRPPAGNAGIPAGVVRDAGNDAGMASL